MLMVVAWLLLTQVSETPVTGVDPVDFYRLYLQAESLYAAQDYRTAAEHYERLRKEHPLHGGLLVRLGYCYLFLDESARAIPVLIEAYDKGFGTRSQIAAFVAQEFTALGDRDSALLWLRRSLEQRFENRPAIGSDSEFEALRDDPEFRRIAGLLPSSSAPSRDEGWRFDLDLYLEEVQRLHADPDTPAFDPEFVGGVRRLRQRIPKLSDEHIIHRLQTLTASLGDGHTVLYPRSSSRFSFSNLDVQFYWFADGITVVGGGDELAGDIGSKLHAIGGHSIDGVFEGLETIVSRDNSQGIFWLGPAYLRRPNVLRQLGFEASDEGATLTLQRRDGSLHDVAVKTTQRRLGSKLPVPRGLTYQETPLYLRHVNENFWFEELIEDDAIYVQFNQVRDTSDQTVAEFAEEIVEVLKETGYQNFILDVRHNNGGNNFLTWDFLKALVFFEASAAGNQLFVLVGRNTFSAAQNFINFIERMTSATFVGEPSSSRPNFTGESTAVRLPWSGLRLSISSRYWQDSYPGDDRPWIAPHIPVSLTSEQYFAAHDPGLSAILRILQSDTDRPSSD